MFTAFGGFPPAPTTTTDQPEQPTDEQQASPLADWPSKGYAGPQPWDLKALGVKGGDDLEPGERDNVSPVQPRDGLPMLTAGSAGDAVRELGVALGRLGYSNTISRGDVANAYNVVDDSIVAAVEGFRRDYGVAEDPSAFAREPRESALSHIGPWTQEAVLRAADQLDD